MKIYHTSPVEITEIKKNGNHLFGSTLFFSDEVYVMTASSTVYTYSVELDESQVIDVEDLCDDESTEVVVSEVAALCGVNEEIAIEILTGEIEILNSDEFLDATSLDLADYDEDYGWHNHNYEALADLDWKIQGLQGKAAILAGYKAAKGFDEQGTVYMMDMLGRESELVLESVEGLED